MNKHTIQKLAIERHCAGELDSVRAAAIQKHLGECAVCSAYAARIKQEREEFLALHPYAHIRPAADGSSKARTGEVWYERWLHHFAVPVLRPVLIPVCLLLLVGVTLSPFMGRFINGPEQPEYRYKGGTILQLPYLYKRNGQIFESGPGDILEEGDRIQIFYASPLDRYITLISIDSTGAISFYQPDTKSSQCSIRSGVGTRLAYPLSIDLDGTPGAELVVAIFTDEPLASVLVEQWMKGVFVKGMAMSDVEKKVVDKGAEIGEVKTLLLRKKAN